MPKAKTRLTTTKKRPQTAESSKASATSSGSDQPTLEDFKSFKKLDEIVVKDLEKREHEFKIGDHIMLVGEGMDVKKVYPDYEYWVAEILALAQHPRSRTETYVRLRWLWNKKDIHDVARSIDVGHFGRYERCTSKHEDIVNAACISGAAQVVTFDESNLQQGCIPARAFYVRDHFDYKKKLTTPLGEPQRCGLCDGRYNPDELENPMHYCPQATCGRWYHYSCLAECMSIGEYSNEQHHNSGLLLSTPDHQPPTLNKSKSKKRTSTGKAKAPAPRSADGLVREASAVRLGHDLAFLDPDERACLVGHAQQQIVRPTLESVVGNAARVLAARAWIHEARTRGLSLKRRGELDAWFEDVEMEMVDEQLVSASSRVAEADRKLWVCANCGGPI